MRALTLFFVLSFPIFSHAEETPKGESVYVEEDGLRVLIKDEEKLITEFVGKLTEDGRPIGTASEPVKSLKAGIAHIKKIANKDMSIKAYAHVNGWYLYAMDLMDLTKGTQHVEAYHWGYAIKEGGTKIVVFGGW